MSKQSAEHMFLAMRAYLVREEEFLKTWLLLPNLPAFRGKVPNTRPKRDRLAKLVKLKADWDRREGNIRSLLALANFFTRELTSRASKPAYNDTSECVDLRCEKEEDTIADLKHFVQFLHKELQSLRS